MEITLIKCDNPLLKTYIQSILSIPLNVVATKYGNGIKNPLIKINLPAHEGENDIYFVNIN
jgi:hypothetical protein